MEKEFTAKDMIEFASWFGEDVSIKDVQEYRDHLKKLEEQEYNLYLSLKAKYENK
jgi:hypothetical protein